MSEDVQVRFGASIGELISGVDRVKEAIESVQRPVDALNEKFTQLGEIVGISLGIEGFKNLVEGMAELGDQTETSMAMLGMSAQQVGELSGVAKLSGTTFDALSSSFERMSLNIQKSTADAFNPAAEGLRVLGIDTRNLIGLPAEQYFERLADAVSKFNPSLNLTNAVAAVGGRGIAALLPVLQGGVEHFREFEEAVRATGSVLDDAQAHAFAQSYEKITLLGLSVQGLGIKSFDTLRPAIDAAADSLTKFIESIRGDDVRDIANTIGAGLISIAEHVSEYLITSGLSIDEFKGKLDNLLPSLELTGVAASVYRFGENIRQPMEDILAKIRADWDKPIHFGGLDNQGGGGAAALAEQLAAVKARADAARNALNAIIPKSGTWESEAQNIKALDAQLQGIVQTYGKLNAAQLDAGGKARLEGAMAAAQAQIKLIDEEFTKTSESLNSSFRLFKITEDQKTQALQDALQDREQDTIDELSKEAALQGLSVAQYQRIQDQIVAIRTDTGAKLQRVTDQDREQQQKSWESVLTPIQSAWDGQLRGLLAGTTSWAQAEKNIMSDLVIKAIEEFEQLAIIKPILDGLLSSGLGSAPANLAATVTKMIESMTGPIFAGVAGFLAPIMGPAAIPAAAAVAAGVDATAMGLSSLDIGGYVMSDGLAMIHAGETVVPANVSSPFNGAGGAGNPVNLSVSINAIDTQSGYQFMRSQLPAFASMLQQHLGLNPSKA